MNKIGGLRKSAHCPSCGFAYFPVMPWCIRPGRFSYMVESVGDRFTSVHRLHKLNRSIDLVFPNHMFIKNAAITPKRTELHFLVESSPSCHICPWDARQTYLLGGHNCRIISDHILIIHFRLENTKSGLACYSGIATFHFIEPYYPLI